MSLKFILLKEIYPFPFRKSLSSFTYFHILKYSKPIYEQNFLWFIIAKETFEKDPEALGTTTQLHLEVNHSRNFKIL